MKAKWKTKVQCDEAVGGLAQPHDTLLCYVATANSLPSLHDEYIGIEILRKWERCLTLKSQKSVIKEAVSAGYQVR